MKQFLLFILLAIFGSAIQAQCIPDTSLIGNDIYYAPPGSKTYNVNGKNIIVLPYAQANQSYSEVIQFKVPKDTNISGLSADIDYIKLHSIQNLPPNMGLLCNPLNCTFPGGTYGCAEISGTAGNPDSAMIEVSIEYKFESNGTIVVAQDTLRNIYLVTKGASVGMQQLADNAFSARFFPNPASNKGTLSITLEQSQTVDVSITNVIGNRVFIKKWAAASGENKLNLNLEKMPAGVYIYSVRSGKKAYSGRFIISR